MQSAMSGKKILCVGLMCVDSIQICHDYPKEDSDQRSIDHRWQRGGNASNNCTVLAKLGATCEFFGTIGNDMMAEYAVQDFKSHNIIVENVVKYNHDTPFSSVIINVKNGSRTIIHSNKNMPELNIEDFKRLKLEEYVWIHFEGRNVSEIALMVKHVSEWNVKHPPVNVSVELEKQREELSRLIPLADVVFVGKEFASFQGCKDKFDALKRNINLLKTSGVMVAAWGEAGAAAQSAGGAILDFPAKRCAAVDTLGAGDTFVAATVLCLSRGLGLARSVQSGCHVAGTKVMAHGFSALHAGLLDL